MLPAPRGEESSNHRMVVVGRDLEDQPVPPLSVGKGAGVQPGAWGVQYAGERVTYNDHLCSLPSF